jgi:hypothetical protein
MQPTSRSEARATSAYIYQWYSSKKGSDSYRLIDFDFLGDIDGFEDLKEHGGSLISFGELSPGDGWME